MDSYGNISIIILMRKPKPNIGVTSRKVTELRGHTGLASNVTPVGDFACRSDDTKSP